MKTEKDIQFKQFLNFNIKWQNTTYSLIINDTFINDNNILNVFNMLNIIYNSLSRSVHSTFFFTYLLIHFKQLCTIRI